jgi:hypothetical protein
MYFEPIWPDFHTESHKLNVFVFDQVPNSPGGIAFGREPEMPDAVMDTWHPLEKAQYPDYFSKRVALKKEYIEWYVQKYGITGFNPNVDGHIHFDGDHGHNSHDDHHNDDKHDEEKSKSH